VLLAVLVLLVTGLGLWNCWIYTGLDKSIEFEANSNDVPTVQAEIDSPDFRMILARVADVSQWRARHLALEITDQWMWKVSKGGNQRLADALRVYLSCRAEGHSAEYCRAVMARGNAPATAEYGFLDDIRRKYGGIPQKWIHNIKNLPTPAGGRTITVVVLDGELAVSYTVAYGDHGSITYVDFERIDAVVFSPEYEGVITDVENQIDTRVKNEGIHGLGSCHAIWRIKQDLLKERGIIWRSPSEMNPGTCYD